MVYFHFSLSKGAWTMKRYRHAFAPFDRLRVTKNEVRAADLVLVQF
jgi:hypothetical protein